MCIVFPLARERWALGGDSRTGALRPATTRDVVPVARLLMELSEHSRYLRYHVPWRLSPEAALREAHRIIAPDGGHLVLLAVRRRAGREEVVAAGELAPVGGAAAELALVVRDDLQQQGIGTRLARALVAGAHSRGLRYLRADVLVENLGARRLMQRLDLCWKIVSHHGEMQFEAALGQ